VSKKPIIGSIILAAIIAIVFFGAQINPDNPENEENSKSEVWSARIAGPEFDNVSHHRYSSITLERKVPYEFDFVPMGDSPEFIKISLGNVFSEMFILEGTLMDTGISEYYTWDYTGNKNFEISFNQCPNQETCDYDIIVERYGNLKGSVSISLLQ
tara:strand:+ start:1551 stop:2018 length:468 start_codon:yes stop_codon:yes gene_type:complete